MFPKWDLENGPLPVRVDVPKRIAESLLIDVWSAVQTIHQTVRIATLTIPCGYLGWSEEWEEMVLPRSKPELRRHAQRWAQFLLLGHLLIVIVSMVFFQCWLLPFMLSVGPFIGGILFSSCNATQHVNLPGNIPDFRASCRTFHLNRVVRTLYWHMNYHTEHHMYPAVPCYHLEALHEVIRHDLPKATDGIVETWRDIAAGAPSRRDFKFHFSS